MSEGARLITAERERQMYAEGYDAEHDRGHYDDLARAAATYALPPGRLKATAVPSMHTAGLDVTLKLDLVKLLWPWGAQHYKPGLHLIEQKLRKTDGDEPTDEELRDLRVRALVKAGALIAAAIDSLLTAPKK